MKTRLALAAVLGGLTLFAWGAVSHIVLMIGDAGVRVAPEAPADQALLDVLKATLPEDGFYVYPGMDEARSGDEAAMAEWVERTKTNPHGIIIYNTDPYPGMGLSVGRELVLDVLAAALAAALLLISGAAGGSFARRAGFVALLGLVTAFRPVQQWNWYEFPGHYTLAQVADGVLGFLAMGCVIAALVRVRDVKKGSGAPA